MFKYGKILVPLSGGVRGLLTDSLCDVKDMLQYNKGKTFIFYIYVYSSRKAY
jgi:hypothetical protein